VNETHATVNETHATVSETDTTVNETHTTVNNTHATVNERKADMNKYHTNINKYHDKYCISEDWEGGRSVIQSEAKNPDKTSSLIPIKNILKENKEWILRCALNDGKRFSFFLDGEKAIAINMSHSPSMGEAQTILFRIIPKDVSEDIG